MSAAIAEAYRVLKPGGVLLCTVPASGRISYEARGLDSDYWRFTEASVRRLFAAAFPIDAFEVNGFGNVLASAAFLYGLAPSELAAHELDDVDPYFAVVYAIRAVKPSPALCADSPRQHADTESLDSLPMAARAEVAGVVMMYPRVSSRGESSALCLPVERLRERLDYLNRYGYRVVPLSEFCGAAGRGPNDGPMVALTFDDGYVEMLDVVARTRRAFHFRHVPSSSAKRWTVPRSSGGMP